MVKKKNLFNFMFSGLKGFSVELITNFVIGLGVLMTFLLFQGIPILLFVSFIALLGLRLALWGWLANMFYKWK